MTMTPATFMLMMVRLSQILLLSPGCASFSFPAGAPSLSTRRKCSHRLDEPEAGESNFGRQAYWDGSYRRGDAGADLPGDGGGGAEGEDEGFSWYCGWTDELGPFFEELVPDRDAYVLVPGIGNDVAIRDMFDAGGYRRLAAFDYAPAGVRLARDLFGDARLRAIAARVGTPARDVFRVCDARDLTAEYAGGTFDAILDKGTLDSIYLSGGKDKAKAERNLSRAVSEMKRVLKGGGIVFSVTAACEAAVRASFGGDGDWEPVRDGGLHITEDGYASNNVDATILAWRLASTA